VKRTTRKRRAAAAAHDLALPLELREQLARVRTRARQLAHELELLAVLEDELARRFRLLCSRPTRTEREP
jgi:hypothetical protein